MNQLQCISELYRSILTTAVLLCVYPGYIRATMLLYLCYYSGSKAVNNIVLDITYSVILISPMLMTSAVYPAIIPLDSTSDMAAD